jgi:hypothetical protein
LECKKHSPFVIPGSCIARESHYFQCLKALSAAISIASAMLLVGCADPLEKPITQEAGEKFQRGITGHGSLGPMDRSNDPDLKPSEPDSQHP